jgi:hypothetical protein
MVSAQPITWPDQVAHDDIEGDEGICWHANGPHAAPATVEREH